MATWSRPALAPMAGRRRAGSSNSATLLLAALLLLLPGGVGGRMLSGAAFVSRTGSRSSSRHLPRIARRRPAPAAAAAAAPVALFKMAGSSSAASAASASTSTSKRGFPTSDRIRTTLDPCVILMKQLIAKHAHQWEDRGGIYSLAQGVVYWKPPPSALDALTDAVSNDDLLHAYCPDEGLPELIAALKEKVAAENGLDGRGTEIIVTSGANQAYVNCILTLLSEGEKCVVFRPYYFNHVMAVQMTRGEESLLVGSCGDDGVPDLAWLEQQFQSEGGDRIKVVTLVNPGNPTGASLPRSVLDDAVRICRDNGAWLVMDNTYEHFDHPGVNRDDDCGVPFWCSPEPHVIHIFSFSKAFALAGFRVGYIAINAGASEEDGRAREAYDQMLKVQDTIPICPARPSQVAALGALSAGREWVAENVATLDAGREAIMEAIRPLGTAMGGTGAMYVMAKLPSDMDVDDVEFAERLVERHGIAVIPGSFCGFPGWIRVCYSNLDPEMCRSAADRLRGGIRELCGGGGGAGGKAEE